MVKKQHIDLEFEMLDVVDFTDAEMRLFKEACSAATTSYSPYSHFAVGAAALLSNGKIVIGSNQENCAYPSGICAERNAVFHAGCSYPNETIVVLCIVAKDSEGRYTQRPISPCGACRQVLIESENRNGSPMTILLYGSNGCYRIPSAHALMPLTFDSSYLE